MKLILGLLVAMSTIAAFAALPESNNEDLQDILNRSEKRAVIKQILNLEDMVRYDQLSDDTLNEISDLLGEAIKIAKGDSGAVESSVVCMKQGNGLFYPFNFESQKVVGSERSAAGHHNLVDCQSTLVEDNHVLTCYKNSNGLYYPSNAATGDIMGSQRSAAGHHNLVDCRGTLPTKDQKLACFKHSNGLYYPSKSSDGTIVGSDKSSAGYHNHTECKKVLP